METVLALGGHGFTLDPPDRAICDLLLRLARERAGPKRRPRICVLPTSGEDTAEQTAGFYRAFGDRECEPSDLTHFRFRRRPSALRDHVLDQDLVYAGGGSMVGMIALWEAQELGSVLSIARREGIVLAGQGGGAMCWFEAGIGGSGSSSAGLGLLPGSLCAHYHREPQRRSAYLEGVARGMPGGYGLDDYAGLLWKGDRLSGAVSARRGARAYRVRVSGEGVAEDALPAKLLPAPAPKQMRDDISEFRRVARARARDRRRATWLG